LKAAAVFFEKSLIDSDKLACLAWWFPMRREDEDQMLPHAVFVHSGPEEAYLENSISKKRFKAAKKIMEPNNNYQGNI
jgi:hypothetical protein